MSLLYVWKRLGHGYIGRTERKGIPSSCEKKFLDSLKFCCGYYTFTDFNFNLELNMHFMFLVNISQKEVY